MDVKGQPEDLKIGQLRPTSKSVNVVVKVVNMFEPKEIPSRTGGKARVVTEALVGDETASIIMSLWGDQSKDVEEGDVLEITNGYVSLVRGHMRLNIGKYGSKAKSEQEIKEVNTELNMSDKEQPIPERKPRFMGYGRPQIGGGYDPRHGRR